MCAPGVSPLFAQEASPRLIDIAPFDQMTLKDVDGKMKDVKIEPLDRRPQAGTKYRVVVIDPEVPDPEREIRWLDSPEYVYKSYTDLVIEELDQFLNDGDLDKAFGNLMYLRQNFPEAPGLETTYVRYLYADVERLTRTKKFEEAMSTAEELYERDKSYAPSGKPNVKTIMSYIISQNASVILEANNFVAARSYLDLIELRYRDEFEPVLKALRQQLIDQAEDKKKEAYAHLKAGRYRDARKAARRMVAIYPKVEGAQQLMIDIVGQYKLIVVGVTQHSIESDPRSLHNWASRRTGAVSHRLLCEFQEQGPDGGRYSSPVAAIDVAEDSNAMSFDLSKSTTGVFSDAYNASQRLNSVASLSSPEYSTGWAQLIDQFRIADANKVEVNFRRMHVLPQALLQIPVAKPTIENGKLVYPQDGAYIVSQRDADRLIFKVNPEYKVDVGAQNFELEEITFETSRDALDALRRGDIDMIDRLHPGDAAELLDTEDSGLVVGRYDLPTVHMLIPNQRNEHMKSRTFRRALMYAIDRQQILERVLLRNLGDLADCEVISGPFPKGIQGNESLGYAYNDALEPRPHEPRLALTLGELSQREIESISKLRNIKTPPRPKLTLAHPATEVAREACNSIAEQFFAVGFECDLKELPPGETLDASGDYDLLYAEIAMWEPLVDADRLFGAQGIVPESGPYVNLALRKLESSTEWDQARSRLTDLHRMTFTDMTVIPLWQLAEHFAFHKALRNVETQRLTLYNDVEKWQVTPAVE